jgi:diacylglycerol kinase family enzyme
MPGWPCIFVSINKGSLTLWFPPAVTVARMIAAEAKPPAVLIVNPYAGRLSDADREVVITALKARYDIEGFSTTGRGNAIDVARKAAEGGVPLVIAFGGDGHVNEVANGLAGTDTAMAIVPGGTMNVFARSLGVATDAMAAVNMLHARMDDPPGRVSLGRIDERYFTFSAGCGFDAEAAELVDRDYPKKRRFGEVFFYWSAFRVLAGTYRHRKPGMTLEGSFGRIPVAMAIGCNTGPYAYLGKRTINLTPNVRLEKGLDVFALRTMRIEAFPAYTWRCLVSGDLVHHEDAFYEHDLDGFTLESEKPFHRHVDGEPLGEATSARFSIEPDILKVKV